MIKIHLPAGFESEKIYILTVLFKEFLGIDFAFQYHDKNVYKISLPNNKTLTLADHFFDIDESQWCLPSSLPKQPLPSFIFPDYIYGSHDNRAKQLPIIYGKYLDDGGWINMSSNDVQLGVDIFGSAFFMMTRYEEVVKKTVDSHGRFPVEDSLAYQENFLDRPIINEYIELLWACLKHLCPSLSRKPRNFSIKLSHDVDRPFGMFGKSFSQILRNVLGDIRHRKDPRLAMNRFFRYRAVSKGDCSKDVNNTFNFIMNVSEKHNLQSAFYFIAGKVKGSQFDSVYELDMPFIRMLMCEIYSRGHEIGLHPSYYSLDNPEQLALEFAKLQQVADEENIVQSRWGGRQHYLRWQAGKTWDQWAEVGIDYDSSLSYPGSVGFRCGVCFEFPVYSLPKRKILPLVERPLVVMDCSLFDYMGLSFEQAFNKVVMLAEACKHYGGDMTILWHNSELLTRRERLFYAHLIEGVTNVQ